MLEYRTVVLLIHEIGHALGLDHPEVDGLDPGELEAIIFPAAPTTITRTPTADDIAGIQSLYGVPEPSTVTLGVIGLLVFVATGGRRTRFVLATSRASR